MVLGALAAIARLLLVRFRDGTRLLSGPAWALTSVLFCSYWLPELLSAIDAVDQGRAIREALVDLRYLPFLWLAAAAVANRSEEHTSELQSLMRISYAVFCLKKKKNIHTHAIN